MTPHRRAALTAGTLFILATAATLSATALMPTLDGPDTLSRIAGHSGAMATALLLTFLAATASLGIAIALYAVLHVSHPAIALGSVVFRAVEAVFYIVGAVSLLAVLSLATSTASPASSPPTSGTITDTLIAVHDRAGVAAVSSFVIGGLLYYVALYRTQLIPRWLAGWGIVALPVMAIACGLALYNDQPVTHYVLLAAPIGIQEIVVAIWLLAKGFTAPVCLTDGERPPAVIQQTAPTR